MKNIIIADGHMHLGSDPLILNTGGDLSGFLEKMDSLSIGIAYSSHYCWLLSRFKDGFEMSLKAYEESEGRIHFLGVYDPGKGKESLRYLESALKSPGFAGIKIHPSFHSTFADDPSYLPAWDFARKYKKTILSHTWSLTENPVQKFSIPRLFEKNINDYGDVNIILGHAGGRRNGRLQAIDLAASHSNVYLDIAGDIFCPGLIGKLVEKPGAEKIIFGSDWPWFDPMCYLPRIFLAPISMKQKEMILCGNAMALFGPHIHPEENNDKISKDR